MHTVQTLDHTRPSGRLAANQIARSKLLILLAAVISFVLSVSLWFNGHENQGRYNDAQQQVYREQALRAQAVAAAAEPAVSSVS